MLIASDAISATHRWVEKLFIEKDGQHFCENCYYTAFNPKCAHCNQTIKGQYISALGKSWHPDHFVCTECGEPFEGNQFHKHNDKPYCEKHFNELFAETCAKCARKIEGQVFEALDRKYHLECFTCTVGDHKIGEGVNFHVQSDKIYCPEHFEELFLQRCAGCNQIIKGQYVKVLDSHFHPTCWKCTDCGSVISSDNCGQSGGKFYCRSCVTKRGGASGPSPGSSGTGSDKASAALEKVRQVREEKAVTESSSPAPTARRETVAPNPERPGSTFFEYAALRDMTSEACTKNGVDFGLKENWLSPAEFLKAFGMDKPTFEKLPQWKKQRIKKNLGLL